MGSIHPVELFDYVHEQGHFQLEHYHCYCCVGCPIAAENSTIHPPRFCNTCYSTMGRMRKAKLDGRVYRTALLLHTWSEHQPDNCSTCSLVEGGSQVAGQKQQRMCWGAPLCLLTISGLWYRASLPLTKDRFLFSAGIPLSNLLCKCDTVLDEPIELPCKHLVCRECCFNILKDNLHSLPCPHCQCNHPLQQSTFRTPAPLTDKLLQQLVIRCDRSEACNKVVHLRDLKSHLESKCKLLTNSTITSSVTLDQILQQPVNAPATQIEMEAAGHVVRKILAQSVTSPV